MAKRKSTGKRQRFEVFKRDKFTCCYCGRTPPAVVLVIDHIIPVARGGETVAHNLITSCETCNQGKSDVLLTDIPQPIGESLAAQVEQQEQLAEYNRYLLDQRKAEGEVANAIGSYWNDKIVSERDRGKWTFNDDRMTTARTFLKRLPITEIYDAVDIAMSLVPPRGMNDHATFKYFCGVCWRKIRDREGRNG